MINISKLEKELKPLGWYYEPIANGHSFDIDLALYWIDENDEFYQFTLTIVGVIEHDDIYIQIIEEQYETEYIFTQVNIDEIDKLLNYRQEVELSQSKALQATINEFFNLTI